MINGMHCLFQFVRFSEFWNLSFFEIIKGIRMFTFKQHYFRSDVTMNKSETCYQVGERQFWRMCFISSFVNCTLLLTKSHISGLFSIDKVVYGIWKSPKYAISMQKREKGDNEYRSVSSVMTTTVTAAVVVRTCHWSRQRKNVLYRASAAEE